LPKEKAELLGSRLKEKNVGSWKIYVFVEKQGTGIYKLLFAGW
jgi:hypothetical protein